MKTSGKRQWEVYAELEEIPNTVTAPQFRQSRSAKALTTAWRSLLDSFCQELSYEQQMEYLERCIELNQSQPDKAAKAKTFGKLQKLFLAVITG